MNSYVDVASDVLRSPQDGFPAEELFAAARTAVLMADEATGRVVAINPAAQRLLGIPRSELIGYDWHKPFSRSCAQQLGAAARKASSSGSAVQAVVSSSTVGAAMTATVSTFYVSEVSYLLVRIVPHDASETPSREMSSDVVEELDAIAEGLVITDGALCVEFANKAFREIANGSSNEEVEGQCLLRWLNLTQADLSGLQRQMERRVAGSVLTTTLCIGPKSGPVVDITAIAVPDAKCAHWGFIVRRVVPH